LKRFTLGRDAKDRPIVLLNGVQQDTGYMAWKAGLTWRKLTGQRAPKKLVTIDEWLVMQAKIIHYRTQKIRQHRQSSPGIISGIERRMFKVRDLMMCMAR